MKDEKLWEVKEVQQWIEGLITYDEMIGLIKEKLGNKEIIGIEEL